MKIPSSLLVALMLAASASAAEPARSLLPAASSDLVPTRLEASAKNQGAAAQLDHQPSAMSWALDPHAALDAGPQPFVKHSREYWIDASADDLQRGLNLATSANGALIRMSPHAGNGGLLDPASLLIRSGGKVHSAGAAFATVADEAALRAAGMDVPQGSVVVKLADVVGSGQLQLLAPSASGSYLVHVFEPQSAIVLSLGATRDTVLAGQALLVRASVDAGANLDQLSGMLSSASGHVQNFSFNRQADGSWLARVVPDAAHAGGFGLWEVHAFCQTSTSKVSVPRDARTAVAVSRATARLDGSIQKLAQSSRAGDMTLRIGVQAAAASRYQLAAVLYGTDSRGQRVPVAAAHSAAWLNAGTGNIDLAFDAASLSASGVDAPYELRDLRLINQADMSLLERRERAASGL